MHNLFSLSQLSDNGYDIIFNQQSCRAVSQKDASVLYNGKRKNIYKSNFQIQKKNVKCLTSVNEEQWTWRRQMCHVNMIIISNLNKLNLVKDLPNLEFSSEALCEACQKDKFSKTSFKVKNVVSTFRLLKLLHIDLFKLVKTTSIMDMKYRLVIIEEFNIWTQVKFLKHKDKSHSVFTTFCTQVQNEKNYKVKSQK